MTSCHSAAFCCNAVLFNQQISFFFKINSGIQLFLLYMVFIHEKSTELQVKSVYVTVWAYKNEGKSLTHDGFSHLFLKINGVLSNKIGWGLQIGTVKITALVCIPIYGVLLFWIPFYPPVTVVLLIFLFVLLLNSISL